MKKSKFISVLALIFTLSLSSCDFLTSTTTSSSNSSETDSESSSSSEDLDSDSSETSEDDNTSSSSEDPDDPTEDDDSPYPIYRSYSYAFVNTDFNGQGTEGGSFSRNGLTWTFGPFVSCQKDSSGRGVQFGTANKPQSDPWTLSTDFGETVELNSVRVYLYSSTINGLTVHYDISFDNESLTEDEFHSSNSTDVHYAEVLDASYEGSKLDITINAVNNTAFYLEAVVLSLHTTSDSKLSLSLSDGYIPDDYEKTPDSGGLIFDPGQEPDNSDEYTWYQSYAHNFTLRTNSNPDGDLTSSGGEFTAGGLTWTYNQATYMGNDGQFGRGIQIGSSGSPQYEDWTISTTFPETVQIMDITFYMYTTTSGLAHYTLNLDGQTFGESDFNTTSTQITGVYCAEYNELEYWGNTISLSIKSLAAQGFFLKAVYISCYTHYQSNIVLEAEQIGTDEYEPAPVVPGQNDVLSTKYEASDPDEYYSNYDLTLTEDDLVNELQKACEIKTRYTYGNIRYMLPYSDEDPSNPGYMYGFYDGDELPAYWDASSYDREHVWACSHMRLNTDDPANDYRPDNSSVGHYSDLHNLRICCKPTNVYKSDKYFGEENTSVYFYPNETNPERLGSGSHSWNGNREGDHRGDAARICLYMYVMYDELDLANGFSSTEGIYYTYGDLDCCIRWCLEDEPDEFEIQRNNRIEEYQGNRNPFIDHPELVKQLFPDFDYSAYGL